MNLRLERDPSSDFSTIGQLYNSDTESWLCFTLEDPVRDTKIPGSTAIPPGRYKVVITWSERFHQRMPLLLNVPNFTGIRIHWGNSCRDTEGCILVGFHRTVDEILGSRAAFKMLYAEIEDALLAGQDCWLVIQPASSSSPTA